MNRVFGQLLLPTWPNSRLKAELVSIAADCNTGVVKGAFPFERMNFSRAASLDWHEDSQREWRLCSRLSANI